MKVSGLTLKIAAVLSAAAVIGALHLGSLNRRLMRHQHDLARANQDLTARKTGCEAALADIAKFENHLRTFLGDKEKEMASLEHDILVTRKRIGNVQKIREEYEKLEKELAEVKRVLSLVTGQQGGGP